MKYDSPVALATIRKIVSIISQAARDHEAEGDMDAHWTCLGLLGKISDETGYTYVPDDMLERVRSLSVARPPRR